MPTLCDLQCSSSIYTVFSRELPINFITKTNKLGPQGCPSGAQFRGLCDTHSLVTCGWLWHFSWRGQWPQTLDSERGPRWTCPLQRDHLFRGFLEPAWGSIYQRDCWGIGKWNRKVRGVSSFFVYFCLYGHSSFKNWFLLSKHNNI